MTAQVENSLHQLVEIAARLRRYWKKQTSLAVQVGNRALVRLPRGTVIEEFPKHRGRTLYPSVEHAGTAGLYKWLMGQKYRVLFANDLAYTIHGIDAIAYDIRRAVYLICEAKGTGNALKPAERYLLETRKGTQLSWPWCWQSLVDFAMHGPTAHAFLEVYKLMIRQENIERLLAVTLAEKVKGGFLVRETHVWLEKDLMTIKSLRQRKNWTMHRRWLNELEHSQRTNQQFPSKTSRG